MSFQYASWPLPAKVRAGWTTRMSGVSSAAFEANNIALHVQDDPTSVLINRDRLQNQLQGRPHIAWLNQTHSVTVVEASKANVALDQDASYTRKSNLACCVMTADCLPVFFWEANGDQVAVAHAGWRGLAEGILIHTLQQFSDPRRVVCGIGPAISQQAFEVGQDVKLAFQHWPGFERHFIWDSNVQKYFCDLPGLAMDQLVAASVRAVYPSKNCTYQDASQFYSYRRDGLTGRMANLIWTLN